MDANGELVPATLLFVGLLLKLPEGALGVGATVVECGADSQAEAEGEPDEERLFTKGDAVATTEMEALPDVDADAPEGVVVGFAERDGEGLPDGEPDKHSDALKEGDGVVEGDAETQRDAKGEPEAVCEDCRWGDSVGAPDAETEREPHGDAEMLTDTVELSDREGDAEDERLSSGALGEALKDGGPTVALPEAQPDSDAEAREVPEKEGLKVGLKEGRAL